ncbi:MAG: FHA domain-containing protein [Bacteroidales bacterium]|nr:FHA domain-containing protein [Bacteroidales bacterium]
MKVITIGRDSKKNDIAVNDPLVSQHHLQIVVDDSDNVYVADMGSENGTYVNEHRITGQKILRSDDKLRIGSTTLPWHSYIGIAASTINDKPDTGNSNNQGEGNANGQNRKKKWITAAVAAMLLAAIVAIALLAHSNSQKETEIAKLKTTIDSLNSNNELRGLKRELKLITKKINEIESLMMRQKKHQDLQPESNTIIESPKHHHPEKRKDVKERPISAQMSEKSGTYSDNWFMSNHLDSLRQIQNELKRTIAQKEEKVNNGDKKSQNKYSTKTEKTYTKHDINSVSSEEAQLDREFDELCSQLNTKENTKWRNNVFDSVLGKGSKREMVVLRNLWQNYTIDKKREIIKEIKRAKPKKIIAKQ